MTHVFFVNEFLIEVISRFRLLRRCVSKIVQKLCILAFDHSEAIFVKLQDDV